MLEGIVAVDGGRARAVAGGYRHAMASYWSDRELAQRVGPFVEFGALRGEPVVCVASTATATALARDTAGYGSEIRFMRQADLYRSPLHALNEMCHLADDGQRVRMICEPPTRADWWLESQEWQRLDSVSNAVAAEVPVTAVCLYDGRRVGTEAIRQAQRTHPHILTANGLRHSADYVDPADFAAECDRDELIAPSSALRQMISTPEELGASRDLVREVAGRHGVEAHRASDLALAVSEIVTNALEHGGGAAQQRVWDEEHGLICEVFDPGGGFDDPFAGYREPPPLSPRGRGLRMAREFSDLMRISATSTGTTVWLYLRY